MADADTIVKIATARSRFLNSLTKIPGFDEHTAAKDFTALMSEDTPESDRKAFLSDIATHVPEYKNWTPEEIQSDLSDLFNNRKLAAAPQPPIQVPEGTIVVESKGDPILHLRRAYEAPGAQFLQGARNILSGENIPAGLAQVGTGILGTIALPFTVADALVRDFGGEYGKLVADAAALPFEQIAGGVRAGQEAIQKGLDVAGVPKEMQNLGMSDANAQKAATAISELNQGLAQFLAVSVYQVAKSKPQPYSTREQVERTVAEGARAIRSTERAQAMKDAARGLLTQNLEKNYTPEELKGIFIRVNRGTASPAEVNLANIVTSTFESPGEAIRGGVTETTARYHPLTPDWLKKTLGEVDTEKKYSITEPRQEGTITGAEDLPKVQVQEPAQLQSQLFTKGTEEVQPPVGPTGEPAQQTPSKAVEPTTLPPPTSLPSWVSEEMKRRGISTGRIFNDVDLANPNIQDAIKNDPTLTESQKNNLLKTGSLTTEGVIAPQKPVEPLKPAEPTQTTTEGQPAPITQPEKISTTPASEFYKEKVGKEPPDQSVVPEQYRDKVVFTGSDKGRDGVPINYRFQDITNRADFQVSDLKDFESEYKKVEGVPKEPPPTPKASTGGVGKLPEEAIAGTRAIVTAESMSGVPLRLKSESGIADYNISRDEWTVITDSGRQFVKTEFEARQLLGEEHPEPKTFTADQLSDILKGYPNLNEVEQTIKENPNVSFTSEGGVQVDAKVLQQAVDAIKQNPSLAPFAEQQVAAKKKAIPKTAKLPLKKGDPVVLKNGHAVTVQGTKKAADGSTLVVFKDKNGTEKAVGEGAIATKAPTDRTLPDTKPKAISPTKVLTPKEMKEFLLTQIQSAKSVSDKFTKEYEAADKAHAKAILDLGERPSDMAKRQEHIKKADEIGKSYVAQRRSIDKKIANILESQGFAISTFNDRPSVTFDIPGDGAFNFAIDSLADVLDRAKKFPTTTSTTAGIESTGGISVTNYATKKSGKFYYEIGDGWIGIGNTDDGSTLMVAKTDNVKGMKKGQVEDESVLPNRLKSIKDLAASTEKVQARKLGYGNIDVDFGGEALSVNQVPGGDNNTYAIFKATDGRYILYNQFLLNRLESFFENPSYAIDGGKQLHLIENGKTVGMLAPTSLGDEVKVYTKDEMLNKFGQFFSTLERLSDPKQTAQKSRGASLQSSLPGVSQESLEKGLTHIGESAMKAFRGEAYIPSDGLTEVAGELTHKGIAWPKKLIRRVGIPSYVGNQVPSMKAAFYALRDSFFEANERYDEVASLLKTVKEEMKPTAQEAKKVSDAIWRGNDQDVQRYYTEEELIGQMKFTDREVQIYNALVNAQRLATNIRVDALKYYLMNQPLTDSDIRNLDLEEYIPGSGSVEDKIADMLSPSEFEILKDGIQQIRTGKDRYPDSKDFQREFDAKVAAIKETIKEVVIDHIATEEVNRLGGYISLKRSGGNYVHWQDPLTGERFYNQFQLGTEATKAADKLARQGFTILGKGRVNDLNLSELYTKEMSLGELLDVIEELGIEDRPDVQKLVDEFKKRGFSAHMIRRQYTSGYDRTFDNAVRAIHDFGLGASRNLARTKGRIQTTNILKSIDTQKHQAEAQLVAEYLNGYFNSNERSGSLLRRAVYTSALSWSPTFVIQQIFQPWTTHLANIALESGGVKAPLIMEQADLLSLAYMAGTFEKGRSFAAVAGRVKDVNTTELISFLQRAHSRQSIAGSMIEEFAGTVRLGGRITAPLTTEALMAITGAKKETIQTILTKAEQLIEFSGAVTERKNRIQGFIEGYLIGKSKGLTGEELYKFCERFTETVNIPYGKENLPITLLNIKEPITKGIARSFYIFLSFHNAVLHMAGNAIRAKGIPLNKKAAAVAYGTLSWMAVSGVYGIPLAWLALVIYSAISGGDDDPLKEVRNDPRLPEWSRKVLDSGVLSLAGMDLHRSLGMGETIPLESSVPLSAARNFRKVGEELVRGEYLRAAKALPVGAPPPVKGLLKLKEANQFGVRYGSKTVIPAKDLTPYEKLLIGLNITPSRVGKAFEVEAAKAEENANRSQEYDRIADAYANAYVRKDEKAKAEVRVKIQEFNAKVRDRFPELQIANTKQSSEAFQRAIERRIASILLGQRAAESQRERALRQKVERERVVR